MKAGKFSMVSRSVWRSKRFNSLESDRAKLAYFYFLTCEHQNGIGCYRLPDGYAIADLAWSLADYQAAKAACESVGLIRFSEDTQEVLVVKWMEINPPQNQNHLRGLAKAILAVECADYRDDLEAELLRQSETMKPAPEEPPRPGRYPFR